VSKKKKTKPPPPPPPPKDDAWPKTPIGILHKIENIAEEIRDHAEELSSIMDGGGTGDLIEELRDGNMSYSVDNLLSELKIIHEVGYEKLCVVLQKVEEAEQHIEKLPTMFTEEDKQWQ